MEAGGWFHHRDAQLRRRRGRVLAEPVGSHPGQLNFRIALIEVLFGIAVVSVPWA